MIDPEKETAILRDWDLPIGVDQVLLGMGADPKVMRERRPELILTAERSLQAGLPLLAPVVLYRKMKVDGLRHERLDLEGGQHLSGKLIAQHLAKADQVWLAVCTIGSQLEELISSAMMSDSLFALALDGLGSSAVEILANTFSHQVESLAALENHKASIPLSPGMIDWPVEAGQPQIFSLLETGRIGVSLTESIMMWPRKSISLVLGTGKDISIQGRACDYCSLNQTCRYQDHYG